MSKLAPKEEFSIMEILVANLVGRGLEYKDIGVRLSIVPSTVKMHAQNASAKLPGKDPPRMKLQIWYRGASREIMDPKTLGQTPACLREVVPE